MERRTRNLIIALVLLAVLGAATVWALRYTAAFQQLPESKTVNEVVNTVANTAKNIGEQEPAPAEYSIERVAAGLQVPWSILFTDKNRMLITERPGRIRVIENGALRETPLHTFSNVSTRSEEGLMGLAKDPLYVENRFVYACVATNAGSGIQTQIVRFRDDGVGVSDITTIFDRIPAAPNHAGCRLGFGPDGKLYITTGDSQRPQSAQDTGELSGKILRIHADGTIPQDNPFGAESAVYSYGHRNPQGIAWHPESGVLISTEHGPSLNDGPAGGDEVNRIERGANYGWPVVHHDESREGMTSPLTQFTPAVAPASAMVYSGSIFPQWKNQLFFGALRGEGVYRVTFTDAQVTQIGSYEKMSDIQVGRVRDIVESPDGLIYFTTSNRDGRGNVREGDDAIYRIAPKP